MKRYAIFAALGPFIGGLLLLFATTVASGYWNQTNWMEVGTAAAPLLPSTTGVPFRFW